MAQYLSDLQFDEVMTKLFEAVGKKFHSQGRSCRGRWFMRSSWTQAQEQEYKDWLSKYINKKLHMPMILARKKAAMFVFNYGWKYK
jgi:hypothetical protein